jgi:hypothetical protein
MFDELLMGWASRELVLGEQTDLVARNGMFPAVMLICGQAAGTWTRPEGHVRLEPFGSLADDALEALTQEATDVERFLRTAVPNDAGGPSARARRTPG